MQRRNGGRAVRVLENGEMADDKWSKKNGLEDAKEEEEVADIGERISQEDEGSEGYKLQELGGRGNEGEQVVVERQQSDGFGEQEPERFQKIEEEEDEEDDDDEIDGPPPGWGSSLPQLSPAGKVKQGQLQEGERRHLTSLDEVDEEQQVDEVEERGESVKEEDEERLGKDDDENEGPPPGWGTTLQPAYPPPSNQSFHPSGSHEDEEDDDDDDQIEGPPPGWSSPSWQQQLSSTPSQDKCLNPLPPKRNHLFCKSCNRHLSYPQGSMKVRCSTCQIVHQALEEKAQMVCGFCRRLLSYPQGSRFVQCSLCKQANYVLQEHEVGQVKCENCSELLMYPNGAPSVRCTKCHFVTDIGDHNRRPLLSVQQGRASPDTLAH